MKLENKSKFWNAVVIWKLVQNLKIGPKCEPIGTLEEGSTIKQIEPIRLLKLGMRIKLTESIIFIELNWTINLDGTLGLFEDSITIELDRPIVSLKGGSIIKRNEPIKYIKEWMAIDRNMSTVALECLDISRCMPITPDDWTWRRVKLVLGVPISFSESDPTIN